MFGRRGWVVPALLLIAPAPALANVITDWDEKAVALVQPGTVFPPPTALRTTAILHLAMFEAVNSIERRYRPYRVQVAAPADASKEATATSAAGAVRHYSRNGPRGRAPISGSPLPDFRTFSRSPAQAVPRF